MSRTLDPRVTSLPIVLGGMLAFGIAFGYVEAAVVVDLRTALGQSPQPVFPLQEATTETGRLVAIEMGRELATLVMLAGVGIAVGRSWLERLAWCAVAFRAWDLAYYGWLNVFTGWPPALDTWDVLFLLPLPWVGPVWAPMGVSVALVGVGAAAAHRLGRSEPLRIVRWQLAAGIAGGLIVIASFMLDAPSILAGGTPTAFAWLPFVAGLALALRAAVAALAPATVRSAGRDEEHVEVARAADALDAAEFDIARR